MGSDQIMELDLKPLAEKFGFSLKASKLLGRTDREPLYFHVTADFGDERIAELFLKQQSKSPEAQIVLQQKFRATGFASIPEFIANPEQYYWIKQDDSYWTAQNYIQSKPAYDWLNFDCSVEHCALAGRTLASIHISGAELLKADPHLSDRSLKQISAKLQDRFAPTKERFDDALESIRSGAEGALLRALDTIGALKSEALVLRLQKISKELAKLEQALPLTICHGDFHPGNVLFSKDGPFVVDWDYACIASQLYDLSYALFAFSLQADFSEGGQLFNSLKASAFLDGYSSAAGVDVVAVMNQMQYLDTYSEFMYLLLLDWVMGECLNSDSLYKMHAGFGNIALALTYCCQ
jgi:hypothetical protein